MSPKIVLTHIGLQESGLRKSVNTHQAARNRFGKIVLTQIGLQETGLGKKLNTDPAALHRFGKIVKETHIKDSVNTYQAARNTSGKIV